jgi:hypothetical protein
MSVRKLEKDLFSKLRSEYSQTLGGEKNLLWYLYERKDFLEHVLHYAQIELKQFKDNKRGENKYA